MRSSLYNYFGLEMNRMNKKRLYEKLSVTPVEMFTGNSFLAGSIVKNSTVQAAGQELGPTYDMSQETDPDTGKPFNHEWE